MLKNKPTLILQSVTSQDKYRDVFFSAFYEFSDVSIV